jgi:hypothetical protein
LSDIVPLICAHIPVQVQWVSQADIHTAHGTRNIKAVERCSNKKIERWNHAQIKNNWVKSHTNDGAMLSSAIPSTYFLLFNFSSGCCPPSLLYFCTVLPTTAHYSILRLQSAHSSNQNAQNNTKQHNELSTVTAHLTHNCARKSSITSKVRKFSIRVNVAL